MDMLMDSASWLIGNGHVTRAAIVSAADGTTAASAYTPAATPDVFRLRVHEAEFPKADGSKPKEVVDEARNLVTFAASGEPPAQGLWLEGEQYPIKRVFPTDPFRVFAEIPPKKGGGGVVIVKTNYYIIIGFYGSAQREGACASDVARVADRLSRGGY